MSRVLLFECFLFIQGHLKSSLAGALDSPGGCPTLIPKNAQAGRRICAAESVTIRVGMDAGSACPHGREDICNFSPVQSSSGASLCVLNLQWTIDLAFMLSCANCVLRL